MPKLSWWKRTLMVVAGGFAALAAMTIQARPGRSAEPPEPTPAAQGPAFQYAGSGACTLCHGLKEDDTRRQDPSLKNSIDFIKYNESLTWKNEDKHSNAFERLKGDRGKRMANLLNVDVTKREVGCLGCHSASIKEINDRQGEQYNPSEGVSCENCHGPYSGWAYAHTQTSFRLQTPEQWAKMGFVDLRPPDRQAEKCLSCHIGNSAEGKVVTHTMYAAGHPPLPSVEVATFVESIPPHWWLLAERKPELRKQLGYKEGEKEKTKLAIVGAAVALKISLKLLADETKATVGGDVPGHEWPDYARFDCWSCHHDLKRDSWRQARGYKAAPGRVPLAEWPLAMVELGIENLAADDPRAGTLRDDLRRHRDALRSQAYSRQFGRKDPMAKAADDFAAWSEGLIGRLTRASYTDEVALGLLRKLVTLSLAKMTGPGLTETPDYDAARHIAWTIKILVEDAGDKLPNRDRIAPVISKLDEGLKLILPSGTRYEIETDIGKALQIIGDYEPSQFRDNLQELSALLAKG